MKDKNFEKKIKILEVVIYICILVILARLIYMQIIKGSFYEKEALLNASRVVPIEAPRGLILARSGEILTRNSSKFSVYLVPDRMRGVSHLADKLSIILNIPRGDILKLIKEKERNIFGAIKIKDHLSLNEVARIEEIKDSLNGVYIQAEPLRVYLENISGHLLGYIGEIDQDQLIQLKEKGYKIGDYIGKQGLERSYDIFLRGQPGKKIVQVDAYGNINSILKETAPVAGLNLYLTIDAKLQKKAIRLLSDKLEILRAGGINKTAAALVALNPNNGEVLALVSLPGYDPNKFIRGMSQKEYKRFIEEKFYPMLNRAVSSAFPPASTFKLVTGMAALEEGLAGEETEFYCPGAFRISGRDFHCFQLSGHGKIKFIDAIAKSCDVAFYKLGYNLTVEKLLKYSEILGLGKMTGIDLIEEANGFLPSPQWKEKAVKEPWYVGDTVNLAIGQGYMLATPIQIAVLTSIIANGGYFYKPFIVKRIISSNGQIKKNNSPVLEKKIEFSAENFRIFKEGMRKAVTGGTALLANIKEVEVAGKTGTAENALTPINPRGLNHTWFTCFAPYKNPEIVVTVFFEQSGGFGGEICASVAAQFLSEYFKKKEK